MSLVRLCTINRCVMVELWVDKKIKIRTSHSPPEMFMTASTNVFCPTPTSCMNRISSAFASLNSSGGVGVTLLCSYLFWYSHFSQANQNPAEQTKTNKPSSLMSLEKNDPLRKMFQYVFYVVLNSRHNWLLQYLVVPIATFTPKVNVYNLKCILICGRATSDSRIGLKFTQLVYKSKMISVIILHRMYAHDWSVSVVLRTAARWSFYSDNKAPIRHTNQIELPQFHKDFSQFAAKLDCTIMSKTTLDQQM